MLCWSLAWNCCASPRLTLCKQFPLSRDDKFGCGVNTIPDSSCNHQHHLSYSYPLQCKLPVLSCSSSPPGFRPVLTFRIRFCTQHKDSVLFILTTRIPSCSHLQYSVLYSVPGFHQSTRDVKVSHICLITRYFCVLYSTALSFPLLKYFWIPATISFLMSVSAAWPVLCPTGCEDPCVNIYACLPENSPPSH
jgi:hypothetical protein